MTAGLPLRIFVSGCCNHCGDWYLRIQDPAVDWPAGASYCSDAHKRRAKKNRAAGRRAQGEPVVPPEQYEPCPVSSCDRQIFRRGAPVCGACWNLAASMCLGKRRLTEAAALEVEERTGWLAKWCRCCGWFHNTGHPAEDGDSLIQRVGDVLVAMAQIKGQLWVNDLVESWDPAVRSRREWVESRLAHLAEPGDA